MKKLLLAAGAFVAAVLLGSTASATTCPSTPYTLTNGTTADATQVMANFNSLLSCSNNSLLPIASPTFTGTMSGPNLSLSGTLGVSGAASLSGGVSIGTQALVSIGTAASGGAYLIMRPTDLGSGKPELYFQKDSSTGVLWHLQSYDNASIGTATLELDLAALTVPGGSLTAQGLISTAGLNVTAGGVQVPNATILSAYLATVNSGSGACGSSTVSCVVTTNPQGQVTTQSTATIQPDVCSVSATSGYCRNPQGVVHQWYHYDSGSSSGWNGSATSVTFPYTPAHGCYAYQVSADNQGTTGSPIYGLNVVSAPGPASVTVEAFGYHSGGSNSIEGFYASADCY